MTRKGQLLFWNDVLSALLFLCLMITGSVLKWVLPPGSGGGQHLGGYRGGRGSVETLWTLSRHEWGDVHFWIAAALVAFILLHLALHLGWIGAATRDCLGRWVPRRQRCAA